MSHLPCFYQDGEMIREHPNQDTKAGKKSASDTVIFPHNIRASK